MTYLGVIHKGRPQIGGGGGATNADKRGQGGGTFGRYFADVRYG